jgi:hypothetical protein
MYRSWTLAMAFVLAIGGAFAAGYAVHHASGITTLPQTAATTPTTPPIDARLEAKAARSFCGHLDGFGAVEKDIRQGKVIAASKALGTLSTELIDDAALYNKANDFKTANNIPGPAGALTGLTTLPEFFQIKNTLQKICDETSAPASPA